MAKEPLLLVDQDKIAEERFDKWLSLLEECVEDKAFCDSIRVSLQVEDASFPSWIANLFTKEVNASMRSNVDKVAQFCSSSEDMKDTFRHVSMPHIFNNYTVLCQHINNWLQNVSREEGEISTDASSNESQFTLLPSSMNMESVAGYFDALDSNSIDKDGILGFCRLADVQYRFMRSSGNDIHRIQSSLAKEKTRCNSSMAQLKDHSHALHALGAAAVLQSVDTVDTDISDITSLENANESNIVPRVLGLVKKKFTSSTLQCTTAEIEEEKARQVYEMAVLRRKEAEQHMLQYTVLHRTIQDKQKKLIDLNSMHLHADVYNAKSSKRRIQSLEALYEKMTDFCILLEKKEFPVNNILPLMGRLISSFLMLLAKAMQQSERNSKKDIDVAEGGIVHSQPLSVSMLCRIGLEMSRLWKQLCCPIAGDQPDIEAHLVKFDAELRLKAKAIQEPKVSEKNSNDNEAKEPEPIVPVVGLATLDPVTTVLYFDHLQHVTPDHHVECSARTESCMTMLKQQARAPSVVRDATHHRGPSRVAAGGGFDRHLQLENCNEIVGPPLWCLSLVHSTSYLKQIWKYEKEAIEGDLFVPLEFDTEWDTDDEDDETDEKKRADVNVLKDIHLPEECISALFPVDDKVVVASTFESNMGVEGNENPDRQSVNSDYSAFITTLNHPVDRATTIISRVLNKFPELAPENAAVPLCDSVNAHSSLFYRIETPYGPGVCLSSTLLRQVSNGGDGLIEVFLDWGAKGYFNAASVTKVAVNVAPIINRQIYSVSDKLSQANQRSRPTSRTSGTRGEPSSSQSGGQRVQKSVSSTATRPVGSQCVQAAFDPKLIEFMKGVVAARGSQKVVAAQICTDRSSFCNYVNQRTSQNTTEKLQANIRKWISLDPHDPSDGPSPYSHNLPAHLSATSAQQSGGEVAAQDRNVHDIVGDIGEKRKRKRSSRLWNDSSDGDQESDGDDEEDSDQEPEIKRPVPSKPNQPITRAQTEYRCEESDILRDMIRTLMSAHNMSQSSVSQEFNRTHNLGISQSMVSGWLGYRAKSQTDANVLPAAIQWLENRSVLLLAADPAAGDKFHRVKQWYIDKKCGSESEPGVISHQLFGSVSTLAMSPASASLNNGDQQSSSTMALEGTGMEIVADPESQCNESSDSDEDMFGVLSSVVAKTAIEKENVARIAVDKESLDSDKPVVKEPDCTSVVKVETIECDEGAAAVGDSNGNDGHEGDKEILPEIEPFPDMPEPTSIKELHQQIHAEIARRDISAQSIATQSRITQLNLHHPFLTRFLNLPSAALVSSLKTNPTFDSFCTCLKIWLRGSKMMASDTSRSKKQSLAVEKSATKAPAVVVAAKEAAPLPAVAPSVAPSVKTTNPNPNPNPFNPNPNPNQFSQRCEYCQRPASAFSHIKGFYRHLGWCRKKFNPDVNATAGTTNGSVTTVKPAVEAPANTEDKGKVQVQFSSFTDGAYAIKADICPTHPECKARRLTRCEICFLSLSSPTPKVEDDTVEINKSNTWVCSRCIECEVISASTVPEEHKAVVEDNALLGKLMWFYSSPLRKWRKCVPFSRCPTTGYFGIKLWRPDHCSFSGGKRQWLDIENVPTICWQPNDTVLGVDEFVKLTDSGSGGKKGVMSAPATRGVSWKHPKPLPQVSNANPSSGMTASSTVASRSSSAASTASQGQHSNEVIITNNVTGGGNVSGMSDTYISSNSVKAALCAAGCACRAVDIVMTSNKSVAKDSSNTESTGEDVRTSTGNVFVCSRPPGHHAGRFGCTSGCLSTGFCVLNNAAIALVYARVKYGLERVAVVDIDVHFGNGTAEILKHDSRAFFGSVHMVYGDGNCGDDDACRKGGVSGGFYPCGLGKSELLGDNYVSVGVQPSVITSNGNLSGSRSNRFTAAQWRAASGSPSSTEAMDLDDQAPLYCMEVAPSAQANTAPWLVGPAGFRTALSDVIIPKLEAFQPELLIISAGFDGHKMDPLGGEMGLSHLDYQWATNALVASMTELSKKTNGGCGGRVISVLEGGYGLPATPTNMSSHPSSGPLQGGSLAICVNTHVKALRGFGREEVQPVDQVQ